MYSNLDTPLKAGSRNTLVGMSAATGLTFCHSYTTVTLPLGEYLASNHLLLMMVILLAVLVLAALLVAWLFYRPLRKTLQTLRDSDEALPKNESVSDWDLLNRSVLALSRDTVQFRKIIQIISPYVLPDTRKPSRHAAVRRDISAVRHVQPRHRRAESGSH